MWDSHQVYQTADAKNYEAYSDRKKNTKSFEITENQSDVIGWIKSMKYQHQLPIGADR